MKPAPFTYVRPDSLAEALRFLVEHAEDAKPIAGGQSLMPMLNMRLATLDYLVDIDRLPGLDSVTPMPDGGVLLGALVRHRDLALNDVIRARAPLLHECAPMIGHPAIRNRGTLGGSIAHADPAAELPAALVALDAAIHLTHVDGERELAAGEFFLDVFTTALRPGELVAGVRVPAPPPRTGWCFREQVRRHGDFALAGAAVRITLDSSGQCVESRVVLCGVGGAPHRSGAAERILNGRIPDGAVLAGAARQATEALDVAGDVHASGAYRREAARVCAERALLSAFERARDGGPRGAEL